jgi:hypothetical protein
MAFHAWLTEHDDRLRLQATIATQKQALDAADTRERDRAVTLKDTLAQIEALKRQTQRPAQVIRDLPKFLSLPQPITLNSPQGATPATQQGTALTKTTPCVAWRELAHARIPFACCTNKPARSPRRSLRANSSRRSETLVRLGTRLSLPPGPTRRRKAKCRRQCHEIDRPHARTRCRSRNRKGRHILATPPPQRPMVRRRRRCRSSRRVRHRPLPLTLAVTAHPPNSRDTTPLNVAVAPILQRSPAEPRRKGQPFRMCVRTRESL